MFWKKKKSKVDKDLVKAVEKFVDSALEDKDFDKAGEKFVDSLMLDSMDSTIKDSLQGMEEIKKRRNNS